jgi:hypothetical protein
MTLQAETIRRIASVQERFDNLVRPELPDDLISPIHAHTGLRAFYPMSAVGTAGEARDLGGSGTTYDLTYNGNPAFNYDSLAPYCRYDGTGDYHSFADNANFDILGTETYFHSDVRGLTWGGWFYPEETSTAEDLMSKWGAAGQRAYRLRFTGGDAFAAAISDDGTNTDEATSAVVTVNAWYHVVARFRPGTFIDIFVNGVEVNQATARAAVFNSNASFEIAARSGGTSPFQGRVSLAFICAAQLSNAIILSDFQQTRAAYGV